MARVDPAVQLPAESSEELSSDGRSALRGLILTLADSKRLLGIHYSDWMLRAPTLETGIAASSMAQDEWGHSRLTYALLSDFGDDPKQLEHERDADAYHSMETFDGSFASWAEMIASSLLLDTALTVQYAALVESRYTPVRNRVQKLLDEEDFHFQYAAAWVQRLAAAEQGRSLLQQALSELLPRGLRWLGRADSAQASALENDALVQGGPDALRAEYLSRVGPVLARAGLAEDLRVLRQDGGWRYTGALSWDGWDEVRRRSGGPGPDADTLARVRGDRNREMRLD